MLRSEYDKRALELLIEFARVYDPKQPLTDLAKKIAFQITFLTYALPGVIDDDDYPYYGD